jgi:hypothetical protein
VDSSFILFYSFGVFAPQKLDRPQPRVRFFECVCFYAHDTKPEAKLHFFNISSFIGLDF